MLMSASAAVRPLWTAAAAALRLAAQGPQALLQQCPRVLHYHSTPAALQPAEAARSEARSSPNDSGGRRDGADGRSGSDPSSGTPPAAPPPKKALDVDTVASNPEQLSAAGLHSAFANRVAPPDEKHPARYFYNVPDPAPSASQPDEPAQSSQRHRSAQQQHASRPQAGSHARPNGPQHQYRWQQGQQHWVPGSHSQRRASKHQDPGGRAPGGSGRRADELKPLYGRLMDGGGPVQGRSGGGPQSQPGRHVFSDLESSLMKEVDQVLKQGKQKSKKHKAGSSKPGSAPQSSGTTAQRQQPGAAGGQGGAATQEPMQTIKRSDVYKKKGEWYCRTGLFSRCSNLVTGDS